MSRERPVSRHIPYLALLLLVVVAARCQPAGEKQPPGGDGKAPVSFISAQYGFRFDLPDDWRGFCVLQSHWGLPSEENGPVLILRSPEYTEDDPHEDIPIMIFTHQQWKKIVRGDLLVSTAFPPEEIGRNTRHVFGIVWRDFNDNRTGYKEVFAILQNHPMHTFRPKTQDR